MEREEKMQFAVLIDAENVSARYVQVIFDELEKYGFASCRRIYGNWSKERDDPFKSRARVYVLKTLKQDKESYLAVGMLVNLICYYANEFVATHLDRFD